MSGGGAPLGQGMSINSEYVSLLPSYRPITTNRSKRQAEIS